MTEAHTLGTFMAALRSGQLSPRAAVQDFLIQPENLWTVLKLIRDGQELPFVSANTIRAEISRMDAQSISGKLRPLVREFWDRHDYFEDDEHYTNARFQLIAASWDTDQVDQRKIYAAYAQVQRMFLAGRAQVHQVDHLSYVAEHRNLPEITHHLIAHDDFRYEKTNRMENPPAADRVREEMLRNVWLPKIVSETEYVSVHDMAPQLLQDLYPDIWQRGYIMYQSRMRETVQQ